MPPNVGKESAEPSTPSVNDPEKGFMAVPMSILSFLHWRVDYSPPKVPGARNGLP